MALPEFSMRQLLEAGVHFGHQTQRWNPRMGEFIYGARNGIHILDLTQTVPMLDAALNAIRETVAKGGRVLFVGTKRQASAADRRSGREMRAVLHEPPLAGRHADQLADRVEVDLSV
jgi:ribosomal protein S2